MNPRLIAIAGPLKAKMFALGEDTTIGRDPSNLIQVNDLSVSRRHCRIRCEDAGCVIRDLESHNGTFINDIPAQARLLTHGDQIKVGNSMFIFLIEEVGPAADPNEVRLEETTVITNAAVRLRVEDALYFIARDRNALMKMSAALNSVQGLRALQRELLEQIFQAVPAERGAVLLTADGSDQFDSVFGMERDGGGEASIILSSSVAAQVLSEGVALLSNDVVEGEAFGASESLAASRIRTLLCVPLTLLGKGIGVIYLDSRDQADSFDKGHLELVAAIANIVAGSLATARYVEWLEGENRRLRADPRIEHDMIGESAPMRGVYEIIAKVAPANSTVLIRGESGTGKELAARAIHRNGPRAAMPFVAVNCAALNEQLLESELFGHERGAFTGAIAQKKGMLELASGGTLFLDEVGEMSPALQTKLLRVLQEREFTRVGGTHTIKTNLRIVAATNRDLEEAVRAGTFRQDLYYRLNVVPVMMPPLRERREDIPLLANYFAAKYAKECKRRIAGISTAARARLLSHDWPGNVRELENVIERAVVLGLADLIMPEDLPESLLEAGASATKFDEGVQESKRHLIISAFKQAEGDHAEAARTLGIHPNNLHRLIRNLGIKTALKG